MLLKTTTLLLLLAATCTMAQPAQNPIAHADIPDLAMIRVGDTYYMSSTTMFYNPGVPIMKSKDLVNWQIVNYAYQTLGDSDQLSLNNGKSAYGKGSWASSLRFHKNTYYCTTFSFTTNKTYIYTTPDIEKGPWKTATLDKAYHDHTLFFDDDGRTYLIYGAGTLRILELTEDASALKPGGVDQVLIQNASAPAEPVNLKAEGSQLLKHNGKYYLFNITWPRGGMRTQLVHRADTLLGPYEGRIFLQDKGVAQGSLIDTPDGKWFAYLFQDHGAVGRIPWLVPTEWKDGWPIASNKAPTSLDSLPTNRSPIPGIVNSDDFNDKTLSLVWQWNHNPVNTLWSLTDRPGHLRLKTDRTDATILSARNTLTQRTFGPTSSATTALDLSNLKDGDYAGLSIFHATFGQIGAKITNNQPHISLTTGTSKSQTEQASIPLPEGTKTIYLKADCDYRNRADTARFYYSLNNQEWLPLGNPLKLTYSLEHFVGNRFALFFYSTTTPTGQADFDYLHLSENLTLTAP